MENNVILSVFLVEDNATYRQAIELLLKENSNYYIQSYDSGEQCLKNITVNPDVVVLDYLLNASNEKNINGLQVLTAIKAFNQDIIVIMLTSNEDAEIAVKCMKNGAYDYIVKNENAFLRLEYLFEKIYENMIRDIELETKEIELGTIKLKRKTFFLSFAIVIILFIATEIIIDPIIEGIAGSYLISILLKLGVAFLIQPIAWVIGSVLKKMEKSE